MSVVRFQSGGCLLFYTLVILTLAYMVGQSLALSSHLRHRRNIVQMCDMMQRYTNRGCAEYDRYGCFCGYGGAGIRPVDGVDRCCKAHDDCYGRVSCYVFSAHFVTYDYDCTTNNTCQCLDRNACSRSTCMCDLKFAECLQTMEYKQPYRNYDRRLCNVWDD
ncbi:basic phospholipase A2 PA-5-like [Liolophura sinensis]|uniref:basic phospholipase A2 PA-5-like n=1 Tax=Liolophura sinensis TaxID=3198878 RepID=UPI0031598005